MIKAAIFDFDGTLADTIPAIRVAMNATMRRYGFSELTDEQVIAAINHGSRSLIKNTMPPHQQADEAEVDRVFSTYMVEYGKTHLDTKVAYHGIPELLRFLDDGLGLRLGVLSNKNHPLLVGLVEQIFPDLPHLAVQGVLDGCPTKPHPYLASRVSEALGVKPGECVMIGDSDVDFLTAKNAGMQHVGVTWGYRDEETLRAAGATEIAHTPFELRQILIKKISDRKGI